MSLLNLASWFSGDKHDVAMFHTFDHGLIIHKCFWKIYTLGIKQPVDFGLNLYVSALKMVLGLDEGHARRAQQSHYLRMGLL
jgi:hypothetical protein